MRIILTDEWLKPHTEIINVNYEDNFFVANSMDKTSKKLAHLFQNKSNLKVDINIDIKHFQKNVDGNYGVTIII